MQASADSLAFTPPAEPAAIRGFVLAVIAHALLVLALTWGINWDKDTAPAAVEAELWSALPQEAAPPPLPPAPAPNPAPAPEPQPQVVRPPPPAVQPPPEPVQKAPDIALEREKQRKEQEAKRREVEAEKRKQAEAERRKEEEQRKLAEEKQRKLAEEKQQKLAEEKKQREEQARKEKQKTEAEDRRLAEFRQKNLEQMMAKAAGTGTASSQGAAARSSGPSDSYAGRIRSRVKPNIVFADDAPGNPSAEVEVRMAPDGTIVARKVTKSSGVKAWDDAVLRALDRTEVLPRDVDGRVHTPLIIEFRLRG